MQIRRLFYGVKGAARLAKYASRREHTMTSETTHQDSLIYGAVQAASHPGRFQHKTPHPFPLESHPQKGPWKCGGIEPTVEAAPNPAPQKVAPLLLAEIKRLRQDHPNLGKEKIFHLLQPWCVQKGLPRGGLQADVSGVDVQTPDPATRAKPLLIRPATSPHPQTDL